jgi:hypothetical protein
VSGVLHGLWAGFSPDASLAAALARNLGQLLLFSLPFLTIAALTRNLTEVLVSAVVVFIGLTAVMALLITTIVWWVTGEPSLQIVTQGSGIGWVWQTAALSMLLLAMTAILTLLYAKRMLLTARVVFCAALLAALFLLALPWRPAFALQVWLSPPAGEHRALSVAFEPAPLAGTAPPEAGGGAHREDQPVGAKDPRRDQEVQAVEQLSGPLEMVSLTLRLRYTGVPADSLVYIDRAEIRMLDGGGRTVYRSRIGVGPIPPTPAGPMLGHGLLLVPAEIYRKFKDRPLRLEIEQFMTLLHARHLPPLSATGGDQRMAGLGRCAARVDRTGTAVEVGCIAAGELPDCMSMTLALPTGARNPDWNLCQPNYAPWRTHLGLDAISQLRDPIGLSDVRLPFLDPTGRARYPVDESHLREANVLLTVYETGDHLVRSVRVPQVRLRDLAAVRADRLGAGP